MFSRRLAPIALLLSLVLPASSDQLYVRNRPFKGAVVRDGKTTWVELQTLATVLEAKLVPAEGGGFQLSRESVEAAPVAAGKVAIGDKQLDTREVNGQTMIVLEEVSPLLGLKITPNRSLGTVDVNFTGAAQSDAAAPGEKTARPAAAPAYGGGWLTSYSDAVAQSKSSGKPILMDFTGSDWCGWCKKLKAEVFETSEFKQWASSNVVLLELDFPRRTSQSPAVKKQNEELAQKFGVRGYPTIIFATHAGKVLGQYGYDEGGPAVWTKNASTYLKKR